VAVSALAIFHVIIGILLAGVAAHTVINHLTLPRLADVPVRRRGPRISVLVPARDEAERIERSVRGWLAQSYPDFEVVVFDDESADDTAALAAAAGARVIRGHALPEGWRGKPHACHCLAAQARGDLFVFADADITARPAALARLVTALDMLGADVVSAVPAHTSPNPAVRVIVAVQNWAALAFVPSWLADRRRGTLVAALNGQLIALRREVYRASGGFAAVRHALGEDAAFGRRLSRLGYRVRLLDGAGVLSCEPYTTVRALWRANARNLLPVFFGSTRLLTLAMATVAAVYLGPLIVLAVGLASGRVGQPLWTGVPLVEILVALAARRLADRRAGYPRWLALSHPLAIAALIGMAIASVACFRWRGVVEWRGRRYAVTDEAA
jgi:cellulose synthase/poly-beta-1,6-N-acetylglucosamine synthase-like glycosyltransferase